VSISAGYKERRYKEALHCGMYKCFCYLVLGPNIAEVLGFWRQVKLPPLRNNGEREMSRQQGRMEPIAMSDLKP
jgi:hypothetical protein